MIVKCQRSLAQTGPHTLMLFYNRARDWQWEGYLTTEWAELFGDTLDGAKFFAEVRWQDRDQPPEFVRRLRDQNW